jgi:hypothetical protein
MKENKLSLLKICAVSIFTFGLFGAIHAQVTNSVFKVEPKDVIASVRVDNLHLELFEQVAVNFNADRNQLVMELLKIFQNQASSNHNQCAVAYYLGEMRAPQVVNALADKVTLAFDSSRTPIFHFPIISGYPAMDALVKIGNPSIPAVIRNLEESEDAKVRELSLKVLYRIEGDKDIVQLRLQKALEVQQDSKKKARLQTALQALLDPKFNK